VRGVPHSPQNLNRIGFSNPQFEQHIVNGAEQARHDFASSEFSNPQRGHRISKISLTRLRAALSTCHQKAQAVSLPYNLFGKAKK
jgi:hypothetical protein